jgi:hypothetical protein
MPVRHKSPAFAECCRGVDSFAAMSIAWAVQIAGTRYPDDGKLKWIANQRRDTATDPSGQRVVVVQVPSRISSLASRPHGAVFVALV